MQVKRLQKYMSLTSGNVVKVTKVVRPMTESRKQDLCLVTNIINDKAVKGTERYVVSETLRRHYLLVS